MDTRSQHLTLDIWLSDSLKGEHLEHIRSIIYSKLTVLKKLHHAFEPVGLTEVFILSESHFTLHTYPEHAYLSVDCYVCNPAIDLNELAHSLLSGLPILRHSQRILSRGNPQEARPNP